jgi:hypothetical protein
LTIRIRGSATWSALLAACVLALLCSHSAFVAAAAPAGPLRTLGIISVAGSKFEVRKVGRMVFGNDLKEVAVDSWGIGDLLADRARALLSSSFNIRPVTYQKPPFLEPNPIWNTMGDKVRAEAKPQGLDAYLAIIPAGSNYGGSNQALNGLGIVDGPGIVTQPDNYHLYALYEMYLIDGHQFSALAHRGAIMPGEHFNPFDSSPILGPNRKVDESWWPTSLDIASNQRLKAAVIDLINQSLPNTLKEMQLVN